MAIDKNIAPYYDDFDEFKNYHQMLFRPGYAVQARELTQMQSILKNQFAKFGDHIFKQGSIVIPGNSYSDMGVPFVKVASSYGNVVVDPEDWVNKVIVGSTSGVKAIVKTYVAATDTDPLTFYVGYVSGGVVDDVPNGKVVFDAGEDIHLYENASILTTVGTSTPTGLGSIANINTGVYYVNGTFVTVTKQSVVMSKYNTLPSCSVLLKITEQFVTFDDDVTLLDPAQGSYNFAAPGADRLKISLTLVTLPLNSTITDNYVEIMRYKDGVLLEHARTPKYNELEKFMARRTYDESGDYIVNGFQTDIVEHLKESNNGGLSTTGSRDNYAITVSPGKAYIQGFECEELATTNLIAPKARTASHVKINTVDLRPAYGRYIYITDVKGGPGISTRQSITLYNDNDPLNGSATQIGTAKVLAIDYHRGDPTSNNAVYKLWIIDVTLTSTLTTMDDVGGIRFTGGSAAVVQILTSPLSLGTHSVGNIISYNSSTRVATVAYWDASVGELYVYKHDHTKATPKVGDQITNLTSNATSVVQKKQSLFGSDQNTAIFVLPREYVKSLRNASNQYDWKFTVQKQLSITTDGSGYGFVTIASGVMRTPEVGTFAAFSDTGVVSASLFSLNIAGNTLTVSGGPTSKTLTIYVTVDKSGISPRTKTLTSQSDSVSFTALQTTATLSKPDGYRIVSVLLGSTDVTDRFYLDNGQTDYAYYKSSIVLVPGKTAPVGTLTVNYQYFQHSAGDFFVRDSYSLNAGYESFVLEYTSQTTGKTYNLSNCLDCRPSVNSSNNFSTGAVVGDMLINNERWSSSIQFYVPRIDVLAYYRTGDLVIVQGKPDERPVAPNIGFEALAIEQYFVPAYTDNILEIVKTRSAIQRYTMKDISELSDRVGRLEEFSTLSASENTLVNYDVIDVSTGLSRFKTGYLVESFITPLVIAEIYDEEFSSAFDNESLIPAAEDMDCPVTLNTGLSSGYQVTGGFYSLPYTEVTFASQPLSSRITNLNPFLIIRWDGVLKCSPISDFWIEVFDRPTIFINRQETVTITRWAEFPGGPTVGTNRVVAAGTAVMPVNTAPYIRTVINWVQQQPPRRRRRGSIICTKLHELGMMDDATYEADQEFGRLLSESDPLVMKGYHAWAQIVVDWLSGEGVNMGISQEALRKWATKWTYDIATPWAEEMAYQMGKREKSNKTGALLMKLGKPISRFIGKHNLVQKPTFFNGACLIAVFCLLKLVTAFSTDK